MVSALGGVVSALQDPSDCNAVSTISPTRTIPCSDQIKIGESTDHVYVRGRHQHHLIVVPVLDSVLITIETIPTGGRTRSGPTVPSMIDRASISIEEERPTAPDRYIKVIDSPLALHPDGVWG